jgi:hypothetical protein
MLAHHGDYGIITSLSREHHVSRPTLYAWHERANLALRNAFAPPDPPPGPAPTARHILTLWVNHAAERGIQAALCELLHQGISLHTIVTTLYQAEQRALAWMHAHVPSTTRALALDEIYANNRRGASLNVVDVHSSAVWATEGPLAVDTDSWTLVLWSLQDRGLRWDRVVMGEGAPMHSACRTATPHVLLQLDQWHLWHSCAQSQARLDRVVERLEQQTAVVGRQAARIAAGQRPLGTQAKTDVGAHARDLAEAKRVADGIGYLTQELRRLLAVVVVAHERLLTPVERQRELEAVLSLLEEVAATSPATQQAEVVRLARRIQGQMPKLLGFDAHVSQVQQDLSGVLGPEQQGLVAWAWLCREALEWTSDEIVAALPAEWRGAARVLVATWEDAVRVSSAVERWHSILRPHLAVRRTLSTGKLALLAVWHNHRVFTRGVHKGQSPLHLNGMTDAPTDWLVALGYPPEAAVTPPAAPLALAA